MSRNRNDAARHIASIALTAALGLAACAEAPVEWTDPSANPETPVDQSGPGTAPAIDPSLTATGAPGDPAESMGQNVTPVGPASSQPEPSGLPPTPSSEPGTGGHACITPQPHRAPLRRLTRFELNNTLQTVLGDTTFPANSLPAELSGNGFGNDADEQPTSSLLVEQYAIIAEQVAQRATSSLEKLSAIHACARNHLAADGAVIQSTPSEEAACARSIIETIGVRAYRRPLASDEVAELEELYEAVRLTGDFPSGLAAVIEAVLQAPDFLYRVETGQPDAVQAAVLRPTGYEMATRLSYFLWGTSPDAALLAAAAAGELDDAQGVRAQAMRLLADERAKTVIRHFFSHYLPLNTLTDLARDPELFPTFSSTIGGLMREETLRFLEYEIFEGPGDWPSVLTAPYTFVNERLAAFYGMSGVTGEDFRRVDVDTSKRLGLLTQGALMAGTTISNFTNPVRRGGFVLKHILCVNVPDPPETVADQIMPPDPYSGATGRQRYSAHSEQDTCAGCHAVLDPPGFALENYDAVGLWRAQENDVTIDASGQLAVLDAPFDGPVELVQQIAAQPETQACFAEHWLTYAYGRTLEAADSCTRSSVEAAFAASNYDIRSLLLALTQTDAFLYLPSSTQEAP